MNRATELTPYHAHYHGQSHPAVAMDRATQLLLPPWTVLSDITVDRADQLLPNLR